MNNNKTKIVTLFNYIGGKTWLRDELRAEIKSMLINKDFEYYVEPFAGGLGAFLNIYDILLEHKIYKVILNDINPKLINFYNIVLENPKELIDAYFKLECDYIETIPKEAFTLHKVKDKDKLKELLIDANDFFKVVRNKFNLQQDKIESAASLLFLQHHCFNGVYRENLKGGYNTPYNWEIRPIEKEIITEKVLNVYNIFKKFSISFTSLNYKDINFNLKTLYYLDPPYLNEDIGENKYSKGGFTLEDQKSLIKLLSLKSFIYSNHYNELLINEFKLNNININIKRVFRKNIISPSKSSRKNDKEEILVSSLY